jgi:hypothetical protein
MNRSAAMRQLQDYRLKRARCQSAPREWMVESTNRCNLSCAMCTRHLVAFRQEDMTLAFFVNLVDRHPELEAVWPHVFGEPLLHPQIFGFIRHAKSRNITVSLSTNITLLDEESGVRLMESGLDYLVLPVDGVSGNAYEINRYPATRQDVEDRVEKFLLLKLARRSPMHVTLQMVRMRTTLHQVDAFKRRWRKPGVDSVRVRDELSGLPGISLPSGAHRRRVGRPCFFLWRGPLCVQAAATLIPCPYYHGSEPFGDLRSQSALEAWNSEAMVALRAAHLKHDLHQYPICARCPRHQPHPLLACLSFFITTDHIRRVLPRLEDLQRMIGWKLVE